MSGNFNLIYKPLGNAAILIEWPVEVRPDILNDLVHFKKVILKNIVDIEVVPAYNSLTVIYNGPVDFITEKQKIAELYTSITSVRNVNKRTWKIPVCYSPEYGIDLNTFLKTKNMSLSELIELHTKPEYIVYCIGFLPGFVYLGGLAEKLHEPRRKTPRLKIPKGSVGIGGEQTGIYPQSSPGGWNIIGNSPVRLFNPNNMNPCRIQVGDSLKFYDVSEAEYELLTIQIETGIYTLESEVVHD